MYKTMLQNTDFVLNVTKTKIVPFRKERHIVSVWIQQKSAAFNFVTDLHINYASRKDKV